MALATGLPSGESGLAAQSRAYFPLPPQKGWEGTEGPRPEPGTGGPSLNVAQALPCLPGGAGSGGQPG